MRDRASGDSGATLAELLVSTVLLTIVTGVAATTFILGHRTAGTTTGRLEAVSTQRVALDQLTRKLRLAVVGSSVQKAPAVTLAAPDAVTFFANDNLTGPPTQTTFSYDGVKRALVETRTPTVWNPTSMTYDPVAGAAQSRLLARGAQAPQFTYLPGAPGCKDADNVTELPTAGTVGPVVGELRRCIRLIRVSVEVPVVGGRKAETTVVRSEVWLPNIAPKVG